MRYYYTDPLAAAWMDDKFGMKFRIFVANEKNTEEPIYCEPRPWSEAINEYKNGAYAKKGFLIKYEIHPDSLHLLEPKNDDHYKYQYYNTQLSSYGGSGYHTGDKNCRGLRIIQRNGISFMWPEFEE